MKQKFFPAGGGDEDKKPKEDGPLPTRNMPQMPAIEDTLEKLDNILEENEKAKVRKPKPPACCGILPCKGRTPFCFTCDLCMDCITGAGCGHDNSRHEYQNAGGGMDE